jgi:ornithine carbamoyltransferase
VPVINGLTDLSHPCQIVADLLTLVEHGHSLPGLEVAWLGDGNNVLNSLIEAAGLMKYNVRIGVPQGYDSDASFIDTARAKGANITVTRDAAEAVAGADVVVTDTWVSMGQDHAHNKIAAMMPYQVDERLMALAKPSAKFLHCLPAHRGEEATDAVLDGAQSLIWDEAENRLHAQKSILLWCFGRL